MIFASVMLYFIHGLNGNPEDWKPCIDYFSKKGFSCQAIKLREGQNPKKTHVSDYVHKVSQMVTKDDVLIGHSMGGLIVQKVSEKTPIKAGICLCSAPPKGIKFNIVSIPHLKYILYILFNIPFKASFKLTRNLLFNSLSDENAKKAYDRLTPESAKVTFEVLTNKVSIDYAKVHTPLFFIAAEKDNASPPDLVKKNASKYNAAFTIVPGCHHIFSNINPVNKEIDQILTQIK